MNTTININELVRVELTKDGADAINRTNINEINELSHDFPNVDTTFLKTDYVEGDVIEQPLWSIFSMLGNYLKWNTNAPFKNNEVTFIKL